MQRILIISFKKELNLFSYSQDEIIDRMKLKLLLLAINFLSCYFQKLLLNDFYGEGRLPLIKKQVPFYANLPNHLAAEALKHRFRNRDKVLISFY